MITFALVGVPVGVPVCVPVCASVPRGEGCLPHEDEGASFSLPMESEQIGERSVSSYYFTRE